MRDYKVRIKPYSPVKKVATLLIDRVDLLTALKFVDRENVDQLIDGWDVPTKLDPAIWIMVKENEP